MKTFMAFVVVFILGPLDVNAQTYSVSLSEAESLALKNSNLVKSAEQSAFAADSGADSQKSTLYPKLSLFGNYTYQTNVPQESIVPGSPPVSFGDNNNYNYGANLTYTLFDGGAARGLWKSGQKIGEAKKDDLASTRKQLLLSVRQTYVRVQLNIANTSLTAKSLLLSRSRLKDVTNRFNAGSASKLDFVNSKRELLDYQVKLKQAQNVLAASLRDFVQITGENQDIDYSRPWPEALDSSAFVGLDSPTTFIKFDALENSHLPDPNSLKSPNANHPQIQSLTHSADAARMNADASGALGWPKVTLNVTSEYIYPNSVILQQAQQNYFGVGVTFPLFEAGQTSHQKQQHLSEALSLEAQRDEKLSVLDRDFRKARDLLDNLISQKRLSSENAHEAEIAAALTYQSYKAGKQQYLDVETANLKALESQVSLAEVQANILNTIADIRYLSVSDQENP